METLQCPPQHPDGSLIRRGRLSGWSLIDVAFAFRRSTLVVLAVWAWGALLQAAPVNILTNPGFESGTNGWTAYMGGTVQSVITSPHSGAWTGRSTNRTSTSHGLRQSVLAAATAGRYYAVSAWVRTSSATPVTVDMKIAQSDGRGAKIHLLSTAQISNGWTRMSALFAFDVNGTLTTLDFYFIGPPSGVDLYVDDPSFNSVDTEAVENLLSNPGFEGGTAGWTPRGGTAVSATSATHWGTGAVAVGNRTEGWSGVEQSIFGKTEDGRMYYGAGWVKTDSPTPQAVMLTVEVDDGGGAHYYRVAAGTATNTGWTWLAGTMTLPATSGLTNVKFYVEGPPGGVGMLVDDCYFAPVTGLRRAAAAYPDLRIGGVGGMDTWVNNPAYRAAMSAHFHLASTENSLKFNSTEPANDIWGFASANATIELGLARGGSTRGHTFVWNQGIPSWVTSGNFSAEQLQTILWDHIDTKGAICRDRVFCWDVVNEAIADSAGALRSNIWYNSPGIGYAANGDQYIRESFIRARAADPNAALFYNDYSIESVRTKSDAVYSMLSSFVSSGVPVDGIGFQSHFGVIPDGASQRTNFQRFQDLGLDIHITELDIRVPVDANGHATAADLAAQGDSYFNFVGTSLGYSRLKVIQTWGVYDGASWIPTAFPGNGQALLFDFNLDRKPAYWGMWNALAGQCEKLGVVAVSSGATQSVFSDTLLSGNAGRRLDSPAVDDYLTLAAHVPFGGSWTVRIGALRMPSGGDFQLAVAPAGSSTFTDVGSTQTLVFLHKHRRRAKPWGFHVRHSGGLAVSVHRERKAIHLHRL